MEQESAQSYSTQSWSEFFPFFYCLDNQNCFSLQAHVANKCPFLCSVIYRNMKGKQLFLFLFSVSLVKASVDVCVWSDWIDNDDPGGNGGNGDLEGNSLCSDAMAIQARSVKKE